MISVITSIITPPMTEEQEYEFRVYELRELHWYPHYHPGAKKKTSILHKEVYKLMRKKIPIYYQKNGITTEI